MAFVKLRKKLVI